MYISEVIEKADILYPNQFSDNEKLQWLNELGAMLMNEYNKQHESYKTKYTDDGIILPDGVRMADVRRIYVRGIEMPKMSVLSKPYRAAKRYIIPMAQNEDEIEIVYQLAYKPIEDAASTQTLCDSPHNSMYIDWLLLKMCYYNRDMDGYNQYRTIFNESLYAYRNFLKSGAEIDKSARFVGWI